jgi:hypothetical protein
MRADQFILSVMETVCGSIVRGLNLHRFATIISANVNSSAVVAMSCGSLCLEIDDVTLHAWLATSGTTQPQLAPNNTTAQACHSRCECARKHPLVTEITGKTMFRTGASEGESTAPTPHASLTYALEFAGRLGVLLGTHESPNA